ncbi:hypothetical protein IJG89_01215 [Candidatus Saccharibacteria bacterium]|nr:hypothetical protein [Candidatus Saccharibacteria bacterium]
MNILDYAKEVEKLVNPMEVGKVSYLQTKLRRLPVWMQRKIVTSATKKADKMPFVVEPYCSFMFYEITEPEKMQKFLPAGFRPTKAAIFEGDTPKYYGIVTMFRVHSSVFWGARTEFYLVAENVETGLLSWIICDYISDTISYDEKHGLKSPDASKAVMTTTCEGDFVCDMKNNDGKKYAQCEMSLSDAKCKKLDKRLWIEGNTSIAYGRLAGDTDGDLFSLTFFPEEMKQALEIPVPKVRKAEVLCGTGKLGGILERAASFPYAQHMLSDAPGQRTHYGSEEALKKAVEKIDFNKIKTLGN